jgi:hypothetical protein
MWEFQSTIYAVAMNARAILNFDQYLPSPVPDIFQENGNDAQYASTQSHPASKIGTGHTTSLCKDQ